MPFGLSFGINKTKTKSTTDIDKTDTTNSTQNDTKASSGTTTTQGTGATQTNQSTASTQAGTSATNTTGSENTKQTTTQFDDSVLSGLNSAVGNILGAIPTAPAQLTGNFDHAGYVNSGMAAATSRVNSDLEQSLNGVFDSIGGRDDSNSMATLLANRARGDAAASLAGTQAGLEKSAQDIDVQRFTANQGSVGQSQNFLTNILQQLKGGQATTSGTTETAQNQAGATTQSGTSNTAGTENTQNASSQTQDLIEALSSILAGTTHTVGTEKTKGSSLSIGGGASATL